MYIFFCLTLAGGLERCTCFMNDFIILQTSNANCGPLSLTYMTGIPIQAKQSLRHSAVGNIVVEFIE